MRTIFDAISAEDTILVVMEDKGCFKNRTAGLMFVADVTAVLHTVVVADVVIGTQFHQRTSGQKTDQFAQRA